MVALPTGTVTFLFADIEGSTRLLQHEGNRYWAILLDYRRLLHEAIQKRGGQELGNRGGACFFAFSRARDALTAAVAAQRILLAHPWPEGTSVRVRMSLHTGEPVRANAEYIGIDLHRAARICDIGHGGQILLSDAVQALVKEHLPESVALEDLGEHRLKDLAEPQHLYQVVATDLPARFPALRSLDVLPNNFPHQLTSFIGREREIAEVQQLLSVTSLLTLTGAAGCGKTRLALQVAAGVSSEYGDGVWLVELAALLDPSQVPVAVASVLGVREQSGLPLTDILVNHLRLKSLLLVLDNCEHLLSPCARLADALLRQCPHLRILATTREALGIAGEYTYRVPSLSLPDLKHLPGAETLCEYEAVRLFVERAVFSQPGFAVNDHNAATVANVCAQLDGIPLAIEFAAARVRVLSVEEIASRLHDRFRLLGGGSRTALARQQTLQATMDWSYQLLSEEERTFLRRLSVFAGGWTLEAAEGICSRGDAEVTHILDLLVQLFDKSLVIAEIQGAETRYRLLETVRQYGRARLVEAGEASEFLTRHRNWYLALAQQAERELPGRRQQTWLQRLDAEHDNLRAALVWSKADPGGAHAGLQLAGALQWFWNDHGHLSEGRAWLEEALARSSDVSSPAKCKALQAATLFALLQGDSEQAVELGQRGLALCQEHGDRENGAMIRLWLGRVAMVKRDYDRAVALLEESLLACQDLGNHGLTSMALAHLGRATRYKGDHGRAAALHMQSLALARDAEDKSLIALSLFNLGADCLRQGEYERALNYLHEGLRICREVRNHAITIECLKGLAGVACARKGYELTVRLFAAAESLRETVGIRPPAGDQAYYDECLALARASLGDSRFEACSANGRAMTPEQAIEYALKSEAN